MQTGKLSLGAVTPASSGNKLLIKDGDLRFTDADVAHGMTDILPTDVWCFIGPTSGTAGGTSLWSLSDTDAAPLNVYGVFGSDNPTDATPAITLDGRKKNGVTSQALGSAETVFQVRNFGTASLTITGNGYVGLGTVSPNKLLEVNTVHSSGVDNEIRIGSYYLSNFYGLSLNYMISAGGTPRGAIGAYYGSTKVELMTFDVSAGRVGILTSAPGYPLTCNGQPAANGYTAWTNYSDARFKEDVTTIDNDDALAKLMRLRPVTYKYNSKYAEVSKYEPDDNIRTGFIAQELANVFPEMVGKKKLYDKDNVEEEYFDSNLTGLDVTIVSALQSMVKRLEALEKK
jgi:hypothetical protein